MMTLDLFPGANPRRPRGNGARSAGALLLFLLAFLAILLVSLGLRWKVTQMMQPDADGGADTAGLKERIVRINSQIARLSEQIDELRAYNCDCNLDGEPDPPPSGISPLPLWGSPYDAAATNDRSFADRP